MWVQLVGLVSLVHNGKWDSETKPLQVPHFLGQRDGLGGKVHLELERSCMTCPLTGDIEDLSLDYLLS